MKCCHVFTFWKCIETFKLQRTFVEFLLLETLCDFSEQLGDASSTFSCSHGCCVAIAKDNLNKTPINFDEYEKTSELYKFHEFAANVANRRGAAIEKI